MKSLRYIAVALFALVATDAFAWTAEVNKAVLMFAEENLSNKSKKEIEKLLGAPLSSIEFVKKGKNKSRLDESGKSVTTNAKDYSGRIKNVYLRVNILENVKVNNPFL